MDYSHDQWGYGGLIGLVISTLAAIALVALVASGEAVAFSIVMSIWVGVVGILILGFSRLRVRVDGSDIQISFLFGWPRKSIALADVKTAETVRNRWWYGWGIRRTPMGWLWNVQGLDAVELHLTSGKKFRIGTDEPAELVAAVQLRVGR